MNRTQMKGVLRALGLNAGKNNVEFRDSGDNIQFCCPFHGERRPSAGIHVHDEMGKCFACGETFTLAKLVAECMDFKTIKGSYNYHKANMWLEEKFNIKYKPLNLKGKLRKIDDEEELEAPQNSHINPKTGRFELPRTYIAPFKSGKATHEYFYSRGFTKETAKRFKVGWDKVRMRVTVPVFWEDGETICGVIGRVVLPEKINGNYSAKFRKIYKTGNETRYYIYENFPTGDILFPLQFFKPRKDGLAILVEGQYDCMWMHQLGFDFTVSSLGSKLSYNRRTGEVKQIDLLKKFGVTKVLLLRDNDEAGAKGNEHDYNLLKKDFSVYTTSYPEGKNDPQQLTKEEVTHMLNTMKPFKMGTKLRRII